MKKESLNIKDFRKYYLSEYQIFDGEVFIVFNIVSINIEKEEITVAVSNRGKISVVTYDLLTNSNGFYFKYGVNFEKIMINDFEEV